MLIEILVILALVLGVQIFLRSFLVRWAKILFWLDVVLVMAYLFYLSFLQYNIWNSNGGLGKYLLPPYVNINYFIFYVFSRIWVQYVISFIFAIAFLIFSKIYNKNNNNQLLYEEEYWLGALALFVVGWPGIISYILIFLIAFLFGSVLSMAIKGKEHRLSTFYFWIISAIFAIIINNMILSKIGIWLLMKF